MIRRAIGVAIVALVVVVPHAGATAWRGGGSPPGLQFDAETFASDGSFLGLGSASSFNFFGLMTASGARTAYTAQAISEPLTARAVSGLPLEAGIVSLRPGGAGFRAVLEGGDIYASDRHGAAWSYVGSLGVNLAASAIDPHDPARALRIHPDGGVQRSTDGGLTWYSAYPLQLPDSASAGAATFLSDGSIVVAIGLKLWRSDDLGTTWTVLPDRPAPVTLVAGAGGVLWAGDGGGLFTSADGGGSWRRVAAAADVVVPSPSDAAVAWAVRSADVSITRDGGATWRAVTGAPGPGLFVVVGVSPYVSVPGTVPRLCAFVGQGVWCSENGRAFASADRLLAGTTADIGSIAPDPRVPGRALGLSGGRLWETVDGALSWHPSVAPTDPYYFIVTVTRRDDVLAGLGGIRARRHGTSVWRVLGGPRVIGPVVADPATGSLYVLGGGRLWRAAPGGRFTSLVARGLPRRDGWVMSVGGDGWSIAVVTASGTWLSTDQGSTFQKLRGPVKAFSVTVAPHDRYRLLAATVDGTFTSGDSGVHWWRVARRYAPAVIADPWAHGRWFAIGNGVLTVSVDDGRSWRRLAGSPATSSSPLCCALAVSPGRLWESSTAGLFGAGQPLGVWWRPLRRR